MAATSPIRGPAAAWSLLGLALLLAGCPDNVSGGLSPVNPAATTTPKEEEPALDPAVTAALKRRPDLAKSRVFILGLDGCDPDLVEEGVEAGRLPNFKRLMDEGAFGPIRSQQPMLSPLLWTTVATGKWPTEHGVLDFMVRAESDPKKRETVTSRHRQVEAVWDIAGRYGAGVGVVAWLASHPADRVNGFAVSERLELLAYLFNQKVEPDAAGKTWPPGLLEEIQPLRRAPAAVPYSEAKPFLDVTEEEFRAACGKDEFTDENRTNDLRLVYAGQDNFRRISEHLWRQRKPRLMCVYFEMLDAVSHYCMAYREPVTWKPKTAEEITAMWRRIPSAPDQETVARLATAVCAAGKSAAPVAMPKADPLLLRTIVELASGAAPEKVAKWRHAVDAAYDWTDRLLGEVMASMDADTTLLVLSDHGFASGGDLPKPAPGDAARPRSRAPKPPYDSSFNSHLGGASYHRENGVLGVFGKGVRKGFDIPLYDRFREGCGARLLDMAPTTLALLGFPKPKDMPGRVLSEVFDLDLATGSVTTYEVGRSARLAKERVEREEKRRTLSGGEDPLEEGELDTAMRGLAAVGYVGTAEDAPVRAMMNMAASYVQQERWAEAEEAFREALKAARGQQRWDIMVRVGQMRVRLGDLSGARREFEETVRASKAAGQENVLALIALAELADKTGSGEAVALRQRIVELVPDDPYMKIRLADAMRQAAATSPTRDGDLRKAIALIRDAVRPEKGGEPDLEKLGPGGHNALGMALLDSGDFDGAIREFTLADSTATDRKEVYLRPRNNLAVTHMRLAQRDFVAVEAEDDPGKKEALKKGFAEHRAEALRWFDGVLAIDPGNAKAHYNRAEVFLGFPPQDPAAAEKELEAALATDPDYRRARKLLDGLRKAMGKAPPGGDGAPPAPPK